MKIFIGWSGTKSLKVAKTLEKYLELIVQAVEPWLSPNIPKGSKWFDEIGTKLETINFGIICLTSENLKDNWILFEAGALSKNKGSHVSAFLLDLKPTDIEPPLALFQHTIFNRDDIFKLIKTINDELINSGGKSLDLEKLKISFETYWLNFEKELKAIKDEKESNPQPPTRELKEILEEILEIVRGQERRQIGLEQGYLSQIQKGKGHISPSLFSIGESPETGLRRILEAGFLPDYRAQVKEKDDD